MPWLLSIFLSLFSLTLLGVTFIKNGIFYHLLNVGDSTS